MDFDFDMIASGLDAVHKAYERGGWLPASAAAIALIVALFASAPAQKMLSVFNTKYLVWTYIPNFARRVIVYVVAVLFSLAVTPLGSGMAIVGAIGKALVAGFGAELAYTSGKWRLLKKTEGNI